MFVMIFVVPPFAEAAHEKLVKYYFVLCELKSDFLYHNQYKCEILTSVFYVLLSAMFALQWDLRKVDTPLYQQNT